MSEPEAELTLDGKRLGLAPLPPVTDLPAGVHALHVAKAGFRDHYGDVYVDPGETSAVWVRLERIPVPRWYQRPWLVTGLAVPAVVGPPVAAALVGVLGSVVVGVVYAVAVRDGVTRTTLGSMEM